LGQLLTHGLGGSVAEWLACWTQAQKGLGSSRSTTLSDNSLRQTVHTHCASVHQAAKLVAALLRVARETAGLAESNGSLPLSDSFEFIGTIEISFSIYLSTARVYFYNSSHPQADCQEPGSAPEPHAW